MLLRFVRALSSCRARSMSFSRRFLTSFRRNSSPRCSRKRKVLILISRDLYRKLPGRFSVTKTLCKVRQLLRAKQLESDSEKRLNIAGIARIIGLVNERRSDQESFRQ